MFENVLAKFKVECTFKYLRAAEDDFIGKKMQFLSSMKKSFFMTQLPNFQTNKNNLQNLILF